jgi:hypothetical protein
MNLFFFLLLLLFILFYYYIHTLDQSNKKKTYSIYKDDQKERRGCFEVNIYMGYETFRMNAYIYAFVLIAAVSFFFRV